MPQPTPTDVHVDAALSNISVAYKPEGLIADTIFPVVPVDKQSDYYYEWTKDFWFRNMVKRRGPGGTYAEGGMELSSTQFNCVNRGLSFPIPRETVQNQDAAVNMERAGAEWLAQQFALDREIALAALIMDATAWTSETTLSGGSQWSDYANSDPINDVKTAKQAIRKLTGLKPNCAIMSEEVWDIISSHPDLLDRYKHTQTGILSEDLVAKVFEVEKIIVGAAVQNTAAEKATFVGAYIWPKNCLLAYITKTPGLMVATAGYCFTWKQNGYTIPIEPVEQKTRKRTLLTADHAFEQKLVGADCGYEIIDAVA